MKFVIERLQESLVGFIRRAGYAPHRDPRATQASFVRRLGAGEYPRFHLYAEQARLETKAGPVSTLVDGQVVLSIHLDQKKPSYQGSRAHAGEYDGPLLDQEKERILQFA